MQYFNTRSPIYRGIYYVWSAKIIYATTPRELSSSTRYSDLKLFHKHIIESILQQMVDIML